MKKIISNLLLVISVFALLLMCGENNDGSINIWWSMFWLAVLVIAAKLWTYLNPENNKNSE